MRGFVTCHGQRDMRHLNEARRSFQRDCSARAGPHKQHLHFDPQNPPPLCNLYVSMLQRLGIETDHFGTSNGTLPGLAMA